MGAITSRRETCLFLLKIYIVMDKIIDKIIEEIQECPTEKSLEIYRTIINLSVKDSKLRLSYIVAIGARYYDILRFEQITKSFYPEFTFN